MDLDNLPIELQRAKTKLTKSDLRSERSSGWGATTGGKAIVGRYHARLTEGVSLALRDAHSGIKDEAGLVVLARGLAPELIALIGLHGVLHSIGVEGTLTHTLLRLGKTLSNECWAAKLTQDHPRLAARISRETRKRYSNAQRRVEAAHKSVNEMTGKGVLDFKTRLWGDKAALVAGGWLWNIVSTALPEVFEIRTVATARKVDKSIALTETGESIASEAVRFAVSHNPVFWPSAGVPVPWAGWTGGGPPDEQWRGDIAVLRTWHKDTEVQVKAAIRTGTMKPALDALNALQAVPFRINFRVLEVLQLCDDRGVRVEGLPPEKLPMPEKPPTWSAMTPQEQAIWFKKCHELRVTNLGYISDRIMFETDMATAYEMLKHERFYTPLNFDWRGRVYAVCSFNFQRSDRVRALFNFADGEPIGEDGIWWLKVHTANCGDFNKISKRPREERVKWCNENTQLITNIASAPLVHTEWMQADKPFLFLAACFELSAAMATGSSFITRLPISFDGSCSGLQHLCAMSRADEGSMVNLTSSQLPQDVYSAIAEDTHKRITEDLTHEPEDGTEEALKASKDIRELAKLFLDFDGNWRTLVKRNVMTYAYSSKKFGMSAQQQVDLMEPLAREVLEGKREEHPFEGYQHGPLDKQGNQQPSKAARYIAGRIFDAIETRIHKPAEAMKFLQTIAKALAHEGKPVQWTTPVGIPWINRYHETDVERVNLFLNDNGVKVRTRLNITTGSKKEIDKAKAANGVAPNFVHALDAAHLLLVANASAAEGVRSIATVHDSFGCLASHARRFNAIIREQFALMYSTHDVLAEILERASADLTDANRNRLPDTIQYGDLNLDDILTADFAFA